jgi:purine-nucleoside phosphorylase
MTWCIQLAGKPVQLEVPEVLSHEEVLTVGKQKGDIMKRLVERVVGLAHSP